MSLRLGSNNYHQILIISILTISAFTHLWNVAGFPDIFFDEGVYMHRTRHVLKELGPEEGAYYDHPFFGQVFLAGILGVIRSSHSF